MPGEQHDFNYGEYQGLKTFAMAKGSKFGIMLVPDGTVEQVFHGNTNGALRPLFSMETVNPNEAFHIGQIADVTGSGKTFAMEDLRVDHWTDRDYNDIIFQVKGATGTAVHLDQVINQDLDWQPTTPGSGIVTYAIENANSPPEALQFSTDKFYTPDEVIKLSSAKVFDADGVSDLTKVDFWVRKDNGTWQDISDATTFTADSDDYGNFNYELQDLKPGHYELKAIAYDTQGHTSEEYSETFTVLSLPNSNSLPEAVGYALEQAINLNNYTPEELMSSGQWIVSVQVGQNPQALAASVGAVNLGLTGHIPNTYMWEFPLSQDYDPYALSSTLNVKTGVEFAYPHVKTSIESLFTPNDPLFNQQWHLGTDSNSADSNITEAWNTVRGSGVVVGVVDTGTDYHHPDLIGNYRPDLSRDFVETTGAFRTYDSNPMPGGTSPLAAHGTAIAGIIAATNNNSIGVSGVAPQAEFAALRLIDAQQTNPLVYEQQIADAVSYLNKDIDIYNNSWKLRDFTAKPLATYELYSGAMEGRDRLGTTYVFAAGNDGDTGGNVNYNSFANSRFAIAVGAVDSSGKAAFDTTPGASVLVSAFGGTANKPIITTDLPGQDGYDLSNYTTNQFGASSSTSGTSAAAATVSGVVALMLQANSTLTWRDIRYILATTARKVDPTDPDWTQNGAGYWVNDTLGFGLVDANAAVQKARNWQKLTAEVQISNADLLNGKSGIHIKDGQTVERQFTINQDLTVESVEVMFDAKHENRGDLEVKLISPDGTESILAEPSNDSGDNYQKWVFSSTHYLGESSQGNWKLQVTDKNGNGIEGDWKQWKLNVYGTKPIVSVRTTDNYAYEDGLDPAEFTFYRTGNIENPLTISYRVGYNGNTGAKGAAKAGVDYQALPGSITIPAGATSVKVPIVPIDDTETEWYEENVQIAINANNNYLLSNYYFTDVGIRDNELPEVYIYTSNNPYWAYGNYASESDNKVYFRVARNGWGNIDTTINVNYSLAGTAVNGQDYQQTVTPITISGGSFYGNSSAIIAPIDDAAIEGNETVIGKIEPGSGYVTNPPRGAIQQTITIADNDDRPTVTIEASVATTAEGSTTPAQFKFLVTDGKGNPVTLSQELKVNYYIDGNAWNGTDYTNIPTSITIPAGSSSATLDINAVIDTLNEDNEWVGIYLIPSNNYALAGNASGDVPEGATVTIQETPPQVNRFKWLRELGTTSYDYANSVVADDAGNVYITGRTSGGLVGDNTGLYDAFLAKYDQNGNLQWKQQLGTEGYDTANNIVLDQAGNVYINGWTDGSFNGGIANRDAFIAKYDNSGNQVWVKEFGDSANPLTPNAGYDFSNGGMAIGKDGLYIVGSTYGSLQATTNGEADAFLSKYDTNGKWVWTKTIGSSAWDEAKGVAVDKEDNIFITGHTKGDLGYTNRGDADAWVAKYDNTGTQKWIKQLGTAAEDVAKAIAVDNAGGVYISGHTRGSSFDNPLQVLSPGDTNAFVAKFNSSDGTWNWAADLRWLNYDTSTGITADGAGNIYFTGYSIGSDNNVDAWVRQLNSNGYNYMWWQTLGGGTEQVSNSVFANKTGFYIAGSTGESLYSQPHAGRNDAWVAKFV